jgi:23S rRNA (uracil1939-C5)-methyltransferase
MEYSAQLRHKQAVIDALFAPFQAPIYPILPCQEPWSYRNKMEFSFSQNRAGEQFLGLMLSGGKGRVFHLTECRLASPWHARAVAAVRSWWKESGLAAYHHRLDRGSLRTLTLREGLRTGERMAVLTVSGNADFRLARSHLASFVNAIHASSPDTPVSIFLRIQQLCPGTPTQFYEMHLFGPEQITEVLHVDGRAFTYVISPSSFFQTNTAQAERLYSRALSLAALEPGDDLLDLYCGTASLSIVAAPRVRCVTGIDLNPHALFDAARNKERNQITNLELFCGDVGALLPTLPRKPSCVFLDPPRSGLGPQALRTLLEQKPPKILYISCNPSTQAEDVRVLLAEGYRLQAVQPVDQFPHTVHIENIVLLIPQASLPASPVDAF